MYSLMSQAHLHAKLLPVPSSQSNKEASLPETILHLSAHHIGGEPQLCSSRPDACPAPKARSMPEMCPSRSHSPENLNQLAALRHSLT